MCCINATVAAVVSQIRHEHCPICEVCGLGCGNFAKAAGRCPTVSRALPDVAGASPCAMRQSLRHAPSPCAMRIVFARSLPLAL